MFLNQSNKRTEQIISLGKNELMSLTGLLTGHCVLRYHLNNMGLAEDNRCRYCLDQVETVEHIICDCEALIMKKLQHLETVFASPSDAAKKDPPVHKFPWNPEGGKLDEGFLIQ